MNSFAIAIFKLPRDAFKSAWARFGPAAAGLAADPAVGC
jgi:hypothetical protein